jgi:penicillin-binding protein 1A
MQLLAEASMKEHMASLQKQFEAAYGRNAPWITNTALIRKTVHQSAPYKKLIALGLSEKQAWDSLAKTKPMQLAGWDGDQEVEASVVDSIKHYMKYLNVGSLSIDPTSGAVKTWIGGIDFRHYKYDHVSQSKRQVGSTFKPIVYTAALESGIAPCRYFSAQEVEYENLEGWSPGNSDDKDEVYLNYSMQEALSKSVNTVAVKVLEETGIPRVLQQARKMGISSPLPEQPSLALGTGAIGIEELAGAYASYVNSGKAVTPFLITAIADRNDSILQRYTPRIADSPAYTEENRAIMLEFMKATVNGGTAARLRSRYGLKNDIAGKTGTTQNNKDAWFVGITPRLVHVSWVGLEHHEIGFPSTALGQGANAALPLFALYLQKLNHDPQFDAITKARFNPPSPAILELLECAPVKRDGFLTRLFKNPKKKKRRRFRDKS